MALGQGFASSPTGSLSVAFTSDRQATGFALRLFAVLALALVTSVVFLPSAAFQLADCLMFVGP